jgi:hypothetical protein
MPRAAGPGAIADRGRRAGCRQTSRGRLRWSSLSRAACASSVNAPVRSRITGVDPPVIATRLDLVARNTHRCEGAWSSQASSSSKAGDIGFGKPGASSSSLSVQQTGRS